MSPQERAGLEIETSDSGIQDVEESFTGGYSTSDSLDHGLGPVNRLMDEVEIHSVPGSGTRVVCRRWLRAGSAPAAARPGDIGIFTRARDLGLALHDAEKRTEHTCEDF